MGSEARQLAPETSGVNKFAVPIAVETLAEVTYCVQHKVAIMFSAGTLGEWVKKLVQKWQAAHQPECRATNASFSQYPQTSAK